MFIIQNFPSIVSSNLLIMNLNFCSFQGNLDNFLPIVLFWFIHCGLNRRILLVKLNFEAWDFYFDIKPFCWWKIEYRIRFGDKVQLENNIIIKYPPRTLLNSYRADSECLKRKTFDARVDVWWWIFVRIAVKCGEKNNFHRVFLTSFCGECGESRWIIYFHRVLSFLTKKESSLLGFEPQNSPMPSTAYSTAPTVTYILDFSCEFKSDCVNVGKQMRWIFVRNAVNFAVNFCKKCGEMRWIIFFRIHRFHRISFINLPQK